MIRDFRRSFEYYFQYPPELPRQMAAWWGAQGFDSKLAVGALLAICVIYMLMYFRPAIGSFLAVFFPYSWVNTDRMRAVFFRGTRSEFESSWKSAGQPTRARWRYLFDVFYYFGPVLVVAAALALSFIAFVGYPGFMG